MGRRGRRGRQRRLRAVLAVVAVLTLVVTVGSPAQQAEAATVPAGPWYGFGGKCLDVAGGGTADGTTVQLLTCNGSAQQQWSQPGDGTVQALGKCLAVAGGSVGNGTPVRLWTCNGTGAQQWTVTGARQVVNPHSGGCLDAKDVSSADGTPTQIWACTGGANQQWSWPQPLYGFGGTCLDVDGGNTVDGTTVQLWTCNGTGAQQWSLPGDGTVRALGKCLDMAGGSVGNGTPVRLWTCNGTGAQQWTVSSGYQLVNPHSGACLDAKDVRAADGTPMQIWACTDGANQQWSWPQPVNAWLTTAVGNQVVRGLQQQPSEAFARTSAPAGQTITVDEGRTYQQFTGGGASFTDSAGWLMNSSGLLTPATRDAVMTALFDPVHGIGLDFLRNPIGASDIARASYSFDDLPPGQTDPQLAQFSLAHDLADVLPLTRQARTINPTVTVLATPWSGPPWMKDSGAFSGGSLKPEFYPAYAQYFVKYLQGYRDNGVPVDFITVQNEPTCCDGYPSMAWTGAQLDNFTVNYLFPALHAAGLSTKVLVLDWNWNSWAGWGAPQLNDARLRNDPNFGGIAWHGYQGDVTLQSILHDQYPPIDQYETEHTGGIWNTAQSQQAVDMADIVDDTRNWGRSVVKWSLALDQNNGPYNKIPGASSGCTSCTGLVTVHNGDDRSGQVDYTIEYYDMGQLTKFVKPGAYRIDSTASSVIRNVAWKNPDGSKALLAYNTTGTDQTVQVNWGLQSFTYTLPAYTTATFTWSGPQVNAVVPDLSRQTLSGAIVLVAAAGLNLASGTVPVYDSSDGGRVVAQWPPAGTVVLPGATVSASIGVWQGANR
ncbi:MAG TPA: RICIN domain-containing protein [Rugosimonospora sp.]|nr:RICIN domain-containing protein [Rugosimonospora sp.]